MLNGYRFRTIFLFVFVSNWSGALIPWHVIEIPNGELAAPTNDIYNSCFISINFNCLLYAGISKRIRLLQTLCVTSRVLLPINVLEDFTKPLSLSRLFGNILADELVVVLVALVPLVIPIPLCF
jgi:F-type H+-transporting ATPase subunit a